MVGFKNGIHIPFITNKLRQYLQAPAAKASEEESVKWTFENMLSCLRPRLNHFLQC